MENETPTTVPEHENQVPEEDLAEDQSGWFQEVVDHYDVDKPQKGEMLKGKILDIQESSIVLDVGFKRDAIIPGQDLERVDPEVLKNLSVGDEIFVCVIRTPVGDEDLLVSLQRGLDFETWVKASELAKSNEQIELEVVDQNRGGLLVEYENLRGFVPNSHIPAIRRGTSTQRAGEIKSEMIGKKLPLKVIEVDQKERRLVLSARVVQKGQKLKRLNEIEIGSIITSRVVNIVDFGVFVDLDGIDGLVHKSEIDWERIPHPSKLFKIGDEIEVKIIGIDKEKKRVSLSRKILLPNPWLKLVEKFHVGDIVEGLIVSVLDFGAFVELTEGLQGLVHVSEVGYANAEDPKAVVKKGDPVLVKVMAIDQDRERISLSMRRVPISDQMEWIMNLEDASEGVLLDKDQDDLKADQEEEIETPDAEENPGELEQDTLQEEESTSEESVDPD
jgi:small subunit ribosomal protein S1